MIAQVPEEEFAEIVNFRERALDILGDTPMSMESAKGKLTAKANMATLVPLENCARILLQWVIQHSVAVIDEKFSTLIYNCYPPLEKERWFGAAKAWRHIHWEKSPGLEARGLGPRPRAGARGPGPGARGRGSGPGARGRGPGARGPGPGARSE